MNNDKPAHQQNEETKLYCSIQHENQKNAKRYCLICTKYYCSDCIIDAELEHLKANQIITIDDYYNRFKQKINLLKSNIITAKDVIVPIQASFKKCLHEKISQEIAKIENFSSQIMNSLRIFTDSIKIELKKTIEQMEGELKVRNPIFKYMESDYIKGKLY